jgi:adenosylcobyric acid synthase
MIRGFIVNRMRGDLSLFADGMAEITRRTGWAPLGLVPFFDDARRLPAEDAQDLLDSIPPPRPGRPCVAVPLLPRISNFDDLDPLAAEPGIDLRLLRPGQPIPAEAALVILPGSKATLADLAVLRQEGWDIDILAHHRRGGAVLGLCGGYQMLGTRIADPEGVEGPPGEAPGLGLLDVETVLAGAKRLEAVRGASLPDAVPFAGYEMHIGRTSGADTARPFLRLADGRLDGATSPDGRVVGTYAHGLFGHDAQRAAWLSRLGAPAAPRNHEAEVEATLDALAAHLERHVDVGALLALAR